MLERSVDAGAASLNARLAATTLALHVQALEVERLLAAPPQPQAAVYWTDAFDRPGGWPPGTKLVERPPGEPPRPISFDVLSSMVAPGVAREAVMGDLLRLAPLVRAERDLDDEQSGLFMLMFTALADGARVSFPGHGGFPKGYDSRKRSWYLDAQEAGHAVWTKPLYSATAHQLTIVAAQPVRGPNGRFAGVTGIELAIVSILHQIDTSSPGDYLHQARLARMLDSVDSELVIPSGRKLRVLASREYNRNAGAWNAEVNLKEVAGRPEDYDAALTDIAAGRAGVREVTAPGGNELWAYSPVPALGGALLVVLPPDRVTGEADQLATALRQHSDDELRTRAIFALFIVGAVGALAYAIGTFVSRPIDRLARAAEQLGAGDFTSRVEVQGRDEVAQLQTAFNAMVPRLADGMRMRQGLDLARTVQQSLLPRSAPQIDGADVAGRIEYSDETGGDYYDFFDLSKGRRERLAVIVGDVSGHGIASALLMASARALLRSAFERGDSAVEAVTRTNVMLCEDIRDGSFTTAVVLVIDTRAGTLECVNAAHDAPLLYDASGESPPAFESSGLPLGIDPRSEYTSRTIRLPGSEMIVCVGTDGIWETASPGGDYYGHGRLRSFIAAHSAAGASAICDGVIADLAAFRGSAHQLDDVTIVVVKLAARNAAAEPAPRRDQTGAPEVLR